MKLILAIAAGGAIGAVGRYLTGVAMTHLLGRDFPFGTLAVNIIGSFLLGALIETMALKWSAGEAMRAFLVIGVMGAFTTFSTFSMDTIYLAQRGQTGLAALYVGISVTVAILAFLAGLRLMRLVLG